MRSHACVAPVGRTTLLAAVVVVALAGTAPAAPIVGTFTSDDLAGGVTLAGRWSEGFVGGDPQGAGNALTAGSWDDATSTPDTHWRLDGPTRVSSTTSDLRDAAGNGLVVTERTFDASAAVFLLVDQPWWTGPGDGDYTVNLDLYSQTVTELYQGFVRLFVRSSQSFTGVFAAWPTYTLAGQANWALEGQGAAAPVDYPALEPAGVPDGAWGDAAQVRLTVAPEPGSLVLVLAGLAVGWRLRRKV